MYTALISDMPDTLVVSLHMKTNSFTILSAHSPFACYAIISYNLNFLAIGCLGQ